MSAQTDQLIAGAKCVAECVPDGFQLPVLIYLFAQIAGVPVNTNSLIAGAVCIDGCVPKGFQIPVLISLASQIVTALGGGTITASSQVLDGTGAPTAPPTIASAPAIYYDLSPNGDMWLWNTTTQAWY